jgi:hypothetical protein
VALAWTVGWRSFEAMRLEDSITDIAVSDRGQLLSERDAHLWLVEAVV